MNNYREKIYSRYVSFHTKQLYGETTIEGIKKQFPIWDYYFKKFLPLNKNAKIIDLGCGNGSFIFWLQENGYLNSIGIDISKEQIEEGKSLGIKNIYQTDIKEFLKDKIDFYDAIIMRDVLEHFKKEEIFAVLELNFNALKKGGILIIQTPNGESPFSGRYRYADFTHEVSFTKSSIEQLLLSVGFQDIKVFPAGPVPHGLKSLIRYIIWKFIEAFLKFYLLVEVGQKGGILTQNLIAIAKK